MKEKTLEADIAAIMVEELREVSGGDTLSSAGTAGSFSTPVSSIGTGGSLACASPGG